jgi:hypothetical protein
MAVLRVKTRLQMPAGDAAILHMPQACTKAVGAFIIIISRITPNSMFCLQRTMPGLAGFASSNAAARYEKLTDHLDTLFMCMPGNSKKAMSVSNPCVGS